MESAGKANYEHKLQRYVRSKEEHERDKQELLSRLPDGNSSFLETMQTEVYMGKNTSLEERLGRHRHYLKRDEDHQ